MHLMHVIITSTHYTIIFKLIKPKRTKRTGHAARMGEGLMHTNILSKKMRNQDLYGWKMLKIKSL